MNFLERISFFHQETRGGNFPKAKSLAASFEIVSATAKRDSNYLRDRLLAPLAFDTKKRLILQYGAVAKILSSPELIQRVRTTIRAMGEIYLQKLLSQIHLK